MPMTGSPDGTAPLVRQVAERAEPREALALELAVELLHEPLERRALELEAELLDGLGQDLLDVGRGFFERAQSISKKG